MKLMPGQKLPLGEAVQLEMTQPCEPCSRKKEIRPGLQQKLRARREVLVRVISGGVFSAGDAIREIKWVLSAK